VLLIGTNKDELLVLVKKNNLAVTESALGKISSITADQYGYITVNYGQNFVVFDPNGETEYGGGGLEFMLNTVQPFLPSSLP
ncbi:MAG: hypothetical protein WA437_21235, partial [Candidatus Sulfotelmatobacter sp.]